MSRKPPNIVFDVERHRYFVDGIEYPSFSALADITYGEIKAPKAELEVGRKRGENFHRLTALSDRGDNFKLKGENLKKQLVAWRDFRKNNPPFNKDPILIEERLFSPPPPIGLGYCCTLDRVFPPLDGSERFWIPDLKTGTLNVARDSFQLISYFIAARYNYGKIFKKYPIVCNLVLSKDNTLVEIKNKWQLVTIDIVDAKQRLKRAIRIWHERRK